MKKSMLLIFVMAAALALPPAVLARNGLPQGNWWRRPQVAQAVNLTPEEQNKLDAQYAESRKKRVELKAAMDKEQISLDVLLDKGASDKEIMAQYKKVEEARAKMAEEMFRFILETRTIVGPERFKTLKAMADEGRRASRWGVSRPTQEGQSVMPGAPTKAANPYAPQGAEK